MRKIFNILHFTLAIVLTMAIASCGNSRDYYAACEKQDFKKAHRILHDMHSDIIKEVGSNEHCYSTAPGMYKEYISATITVYEEEFKFLFDQESDENNPRIKVLRDEFASWFEQTYKEIDNLHSKYSQHSYCLVYEQEFRHVLDGDLIPGVTKLGQTFESLARAYNNKEFMVDEKK